MRPVPYVQAIESRQAFAEVAYRVNKAGFHCRLFCALQSIPFGPPTDANTAERSATNYLNYRIYRNFIFINLAKTLINTIFLAVVAIKTKQS